MSLVDPLALSGVLHTRSGALHTLSGALYTLSGALHTCVCLVSPFLRENELPEIVGCACYDGSLASTWHIVGA